MAHFTASTSERHYNFVMRQMAKKREEYKAMQSLVLESVHPGHFSALPPSPKEIEGKAWLLGIKY